MRINVFVLCGTLIRISGVMCYIKIDVIIIYIHIIIYRSSVESLAESLDVDEQFIMFECGVDDISLKMTHRSGYGDDDATDKATDEAHGPVKSSMKEDEPTKDASATTGISPPLKSALKKPTNTMTVPSKQQDCLRNDSKDTLSMAEKHFEQPARRQCYLVQFRVSARKESPAKLEVGTTFLLFALTIIICLNLCRTYERVHVK